MNTSNGIFLGENAARLKDKAFSFVTEVFGHLFVETGQDSEIMEACMDGVENFPEETFEFYARKMTNKYQMNILVIQAILELAESNNKNKEEKRAKLIKSDETIFSIFTRRFLKLLSKQNSVRIGLFFDPKNDQKMSSMLTLQHVLREVLWTLVEECVSFSKIKKRKKKKKVVYSSESEDDEDGGGEEMEDDVEEDPGEVEREDDAEEVEKKDEKEVVPLSETVLSNNEWDTVSQVSISPDDSVSQAQSRPTKKSSTGSSRISARPRDVLVREGYDRAKSSI